MTQIPKIQIRGSFVLIIFAAIVSFVSIYLANDYSKKNEQQVAALQQEIIQKQSINIDVLSAQEAELKKQSDELNIEVNRKKKEDVTKFDKDEFAATLSAFAKANDLKLTKIQQDPVETDSDGFYTVKYNITLNGSMYGIMNFFNLLEALGNQYAINYFSFRQEGTYNWLQRKTDNQDLLSWIGIAKQTVNPEELQEIINLSIKVENDMYDYGKKIAEPTVDPDFDPLQNILENLMRQETDPEQQQQYESAKAREEEKTKSALAEKEADIKRINEFLKKYYPAGTVIKNGQLIVPMLDGKMIFDVGITFTGNTTSAEPKSNINQYLVSSEAITSTDRNVKIFLDGKERRVPSIIKGVDVTDIDGLIIDKDAKFVVSWNNNQLSKEVLETFLKEKVNGASEELNKVAAEIRFFQNYNKEELDLKKYLIFLYLFQEDH